MLVYSKSFVSPMQAQNAHVPKFFSSFLWKCSAPIFLRWDFNSSRICSSGNWVHHSFIGLEVPINGTQGPVDLLESRSRFEAVVVNGLNEWTEGDLSDEDDELCPVDCVKEFKTDKEFMTILEKAKETGSLVVVDFYRTSCGSCKYIEQGFSKLCKGSGNQQAPVIFLKHNVIDEYDEQSEVAERLRIKAVPLFHFYRNGVLLETFATRDRERIDAAILKYTPIPSDASM